MMMMMMMMMLVNRCFSLYISVDLSVCVADVAAAAGI